MSSYNIYGGTPKKTLDLMNYFKENSSIYIYEGSFSEYKNRFEESGGNVYEGVYGWNLYKHLKTLLKIINKNNITIVQTQFNMGEVLGTLIKLFRPKIKLIVAFVSPFSPCSYKKVLASFNYRFVDAFVFVSQYVKQNKLEQFSLIGKKKNVVIYNGTNKRAASNIDTIVINKYALLDIAGLSKWKNTRVLVEALNIIINKRNRTNIHLYIAGDGPERKNLEKLIKAYSLQKKVFLLGYQENVGKLLNDCDIFVHPAYAEAFGIVVPEAMLAQKPIIVSNAGALPELIEHEKTGLIVEPHNPRDWADAIIQLTENPEFSSQLAKNAEKSATERFSYNKFCGEYEKLYNILLNNNFQ